MTRIARRKLLTHAGGMAAILASGQGPALAQEKFVHWLRWTDFVPASDALLKGQFTQDCKKATGITLKVETVNANDLQSRITSAPSRSPRSVTSGSACRGPAAAG